MEEKDITTITNEILVVGGIYNDPKLFVQYGQKIKSKYDFFDESTKFFYDSFDEMYRTFSTEVKEPTLNAFFSQDKEKLKTYRKYGGWKLINEWIRLAQDSNFENNLEIVKKYSLLRELNKKGYNVEKIMNHPKFNLLKAKDVYKIVRSGVDKISTIILSDDSSADLTKGNVELVKKWLIKPEMGIKMPFELLNKMFMGLKKGKLYALGFLSNEGKTRLAIYMAAYVAFIQGVKVLIMCNETDEEDVRSCLLTTVINNPEFNEVHGVDITANERDIVLGIYKDDKGNVLERYTDEDGNFIETEEDYMSRVYKNSESFRKVLKVAEWIDNQKDKTYYYEHLRDYSDRNIEFVMRKYNISKGVEYFCYDTLKCYKNEKWEVLKQTTTMLSELVSKDNLNCCCWCDIQLTDESVYTDIFDFSSNNIASAKQLKHVLDYLILGKRLNKEEYYKYNIMPNSSEVIGDPAPIELKDDKTYYCLKIDKNRKGEKDKIPILEVDLNKNYWHEKGYVIRAGKKDK